jgi:hypothetical protein
MGTDGFGNGGAQAVNRYRLANDEIHCRGFFASGLHHRAEAREHDYRDRRVGGLDGGRDLVAVHVGHGAIENHEIELPGVKFLQSILPAGGVLLLIGMSLWLESYAATLLAALPIGTVAVRIIIEEQFLRRKLQGYDAYTQRVHYRLVPFLW